MALCKLAALSLRRSRGVSRGQLGVFKSQLAQDRACMLNEKTAGPHSALGQLLGHARRMEALDEAFRKCLGPPLSRYCRVANLTPGRLVLHACSPVWATRLRYVVPDVLDCLRKSGDISLQCRVQLRVSYFENGVSTSPVRRSLRLSPRSAAVVRDAALSIENPELKRALLRLSRHACRGR